MFRRTLAVMAAAIAILTFTSTTRAHAAPPRLTTRVVCVQPDFPVTGSGWKLHAAVASWNAAESTIRLTTILEPGCAVVRVHRYRSVTDGLCGYTTWANVVVEILSTGDWSSGADIYLNDACVASGPGYTRRLVAHEIGHAMGLPHSLAIGSVMSVDVWYPLRRDTMIGAVDVADLAALYVA